MSEPGREPDPPPQGLPPARPAPIDPRLQRPAPKPAPGPGPAPVPPAPKPPAPKPAAPPRAPAPAPATAPGMGELLESALTGLAGPGAFRALAARPAPPFATSALFALAAGAASMAISVAHATIESPGLLSRFSPPLMAAVGVAALGLYFSVTLLLAVMLYGMGNAMGGKGEFDRGLQAAAMMSVLWPAQMMCNWFALAWVLPSALAAWLAACALEGLFGAKPWPARTVCALLGAGSLAVQTIAHYAVEKAAAAASAAQAMTQAADAQAQMAQQLQTVAAQMQTLPGVAPAAPAPGPGAAPAASGLDLLRGPAGEGEEPSAAPAPGTPEAQAVTAAQGMQAGAMGMLDSVAPMLANPAVTKNMSPQQKADMQELQSLMADLKAQIASGHSVSDAAFAAKMQRFQGLTMRMMAAAAAAQAAAPPPAPPAPEKKTPHLKLPEPGDRR